MICIFYCLSQYTVNYVYSTSTETHKRKLIVVAVIALKNFHSFMAYGCDGIIWAVPSIIRNTLQLCKLFIQKYKELYTANCYLKVHQGWNF